MDAMVKTSDIGGGYVRRRFTIVDKVIPVGTHLTGADIEAMANRRTLIRTGVIETYPKAAASDEPGTRFVTGGAGGRFSVIEGRKLNDQPLTKEEAEALAAG